MRENVRSAIKETDRNIARTALLGKGLREAGQTAVNAFRNFADKPEVNFLQKGQKHMITKAVLASYGMQEKRDLHYLLLNGRRIEKR